MFHILLSLSSSCLLSWIILPSKVVAGCCLLATAIINNSERYSNARSLLAWTCYLPSEEVAISAANYNYNYYNFPFSNIMIIVIISDEDKPINWYIAKSNTVEPPYYHRNKFHLMLYFLGLPNETLWLIQTVINNLTF